jgi:hypothetical protein
VLPEEAIHSDLLPFFHYDLVGILIEDLARIG